jgi:hypothetical protein
MAEKGLAFFLASRTRHADGDAAEDGAEAAKYSKQDREDAKVPDELVVAAGEILEALGQDYGNSPTSTESSKREFWAKARRLAASLHAFYVCCDAMPHTEGGE